MRCPNLSELPLPLSGKVGWPWTVESPQLPELMANGRRWPRITIVTPSYNQGDYLEETIRSILLQGYPNLEYIVMDGGSNDSSVEIIKRYSPWIECWESAPDRGQAHAINKALSRATGEWFHNVNSDDFLSCGALRTIFEVSGDADVIAFPVRVFDGTSEWTAENKNIHVKNYILTRPEDFSWHQPGLILRREWLTSLGGYPENYYLFDMFAYGLYLERYPKVIYKNDKLINFRFHSASQTFSAKLQSSGEYVEVRQRWAKTLISSELRDLAKIEAIRSKLEQILLFDNRQHKASLTSSIYASTFAIKSVKTLTDRVFLASFKRILFRALGGLTDFVFRFTLRH